MTHAVAQCRKSGKDNWSDPTKIFFDEGEERATLNARNSVKLGDLTVIVKHYLNPHIVKVIQGLPSEVQLRDDSEPLAVLKPDGGTQTIFEYTDQKGTEWHLYHASEGG
ncbi:hypothetical protein HY031_01200, partial [Candidatus Gottesmanbacteria bacterium]|nr:hypothetical protein [Candidatus Gottesmanbacteria bacterium]